MNEYLYKILIETLDKSMNENCLIQTTDQN